MLSNEEERLKISLEYQKIMEEITNEIRRRQHDFINYKNTINGLIEVADEKDIKKVIRDYMKQESTLDENINKLIYIENIVIRAIIYEFICKSEKNNVNFEYKIENNVVEGILNYIDISNILCNLLNNALEEVSKDSCVEKNISIEIKNEDNEVHIKVINSIELYNSIDVNKIFKKGYSTKNKDGHGYGLYNINKLVTDHNGKIKIKAENKRFILDIYFNNSSGKSGSP